MNIYELKMLFEKYKMSNIPNNSAAKTGFIERAAHTDPEAYTQTLQTLL